MTRPPPTHKYHLVVEGDGEHFEFDAVLENGVFLGRIEFTQFSEAAQKTIVAEAFTNEPAPQYLFVDIDHHSPTILSVVPIS